MQVERKWKMDINTDINEKIMERYHISLTWLDIKWLQFPVNPDDKRIISEATSSRTEEFTPGWLNDEVITYGHGVSCQSYLLIDRHDESNMYVFLFLKIINFYFAFLEEVALKAVSAMVKL